MANTLTIFEKIITLLIVSLVLINQNSFATNQTNNDLVNQLSTDLTNDSSVNTFNNNNNNNENHNHNDNNNNGIDSDTDMIRIESKQFDEINQTKLELLAPNSTPIIDSINTTNVTVNNNNNSESKVNCTPIDRNSTNNWVRN